jgi:hypothetical protein
VKHFTHPKFWLAYSALPGAIRSVADKNYALLAANPQHPSLHLKRVGAYWSVRAGAGYRALALEAEDGLVWFWIGPHDEYDKFIRRR